MSHNTTKGHNRRLAATHRTPDNNEGQYENEKNFDDLACSDTESGLSEITAVQQSAPTDQAQASMSVSLAKQVLRIGGF